jgi:hypothetical protein
MKLEGKLVLVLFILLFLKPDIAFSQKRTLYDFFPHHVGDAWLYTTMEGITTAYFSSYKEYITKIDTVLADTAKYIYYNNSTIPSYKIKLLDSARVYFQYRGNWAVYMDFSIPVQSYFNRANDGRNYIFLDSVLQRTINGKTTRPLKYWNLHYEPKNGLQGGRFERFRYVEGVGFSYREFEIGVTQLIGYIINGVKSGATVSIEEEKNRIITKNSIKNYPNPFNSQTRIVYELSSASDISIKVFDIIGREVDIIEEGYKEAGSYTKYWDPRNISSGTYIIVFRSPNSFLSRKMIYLK